LVEANDVERVARARGFDEIGAECALRFLAFAAGVGEQEKCGG
jgi:hypothetical protein